MRFDSIIVLVVLVNSVKCKISWFKDEEHTQLAHLATYYINHFTYNKSNTFVVLDQNLESDKSGLTKRILDYILVNLPKTVAFERYIGHPEIEPWENNVFVVDCAESFNRIRKKFPKSIRERNFWFLILLTKFVPDFLVELQKIFNICYEFQVLRVSVVLEHPSLGVYVYKYNLFTDNKCHKVVPYLFYHTEKENPHRVSKYPPLNFNFNGCPIKISIRQNAPLMKFIGYPKNPKRIGDWENLKGIDGELMKILSKSLNFTIDLLPVSFKSQEPFEKVIKDEADIAIGGFSKADLRGATLTSSISYHFSTVVYIVLGRLESDGFNRFGRPFTYGLWKVVACIISLGMLIICGLKIFGPKTRELFVGEDNPVPILNFFAAFLGYPVTRMSKRYFARTLLILWILMTLILRNAYQGSLFNAILNNQFERIPKTYEELLDLNYKFIVSEQYNELGLVSNRSQLISVSGDHLSRYKIIEESKEKLATITLRENILYYREKNYGESKIIRILPTPAYFQPTAMYFQKNSIYAEPFNQKIKWLNYFGITEYFSESSAKGKMASKEIKSEKIISNKRLWSLYKVYIGMISLAVSVFVLEIISLHVHILRHVLVWIN